MNLGETYVPVCSVHPAGRGGGATALVGIIPICGGLVKSAISMNEILFAPILLIVGLLGYHVYSFIRVV